jgi:Flp pilus assembly pilin Flp
MMGGKLLFSAKGGHAMNTSPSPVRVPKPFLNIPTDHKKERVGDLELQAQLIEKLIPKFRDKHNREFYREVVESYRTVAREILRNAWSDDKGQDIAEYAVMLAVILVIVVGTIRMIGSNSNTVFSQAASSIQ